MIKRSPKNLLAALSLLALLAAAAGCQPAQQRPEVHPVEGRLTVNGQPAAGALLSLHPADGQDFDDRGSRPWATVQADGSFTVSTYGQGDGAPAGEYLISIVWLDNPDSASPVDRLGGRFAVPRQSQWRVQVSEGVNTLEPHALDGIRLPAARRGGAVEPHE